MLAFHLDRLTEVRKFTAGFIEEAWYVFALISFVNFVSFLIV